MRAFAGLFFSELIVQTTALNLDGFVDALGVRI